MKKLTQSQQKVYDVMVNARNGKYYSMGAKFIANRLGIGYGVVTSVIQELRKCDYITIVVIGKGTGSFSKYHLNYLDCTTKPSAISELFSEPVTTMPQTQVTNDIDKITMALADATANHIKLIYEQQRTIDELTIKLQQADENAKNKYMEAIANA